jgi:hypothetical protein
LCRFAEAGYVGGTTGSLDPINYFFESSTMGTILVLVVYLLANLALPFYYRKYRPQEFSVVKHAALAVVVVAAVYAFHPQLARLGPGWPGGLTGRRRVTRCAVTEARAGDCPHNGLNMAVSPAGV